MTELISLKNRLTYVLSEAQIKYRSKKADNIDWADLELMDVLKEVNWHLMTRCQKEISLGELKRIEKFALGHHDYSNKFALYCAERILFGKWKGTTK